MNTIVLTDVKHVFPAAIDCKPGAVLPSMYSVGDIVKVERLSGTSLDVELQRVDVARGGFVGEVKEDSIGDLAPGAIVEFTCP